MSYLKDWGELKLWLGDVLHVSHAVLHIHAGLAVLFLACLVLRRRLDSLVPFLAVVALEAANEALDYARYRTSGWPWTPDNSIADVVNTLLWPVILTLLARTPLLRPEGRGRRGAPAELESVASGPSLERP